MELEVLCNSRLDASFAKTFLEATRSTLETRRATKSNSLTVGLTALLSSETLRCVVSRTLSRIEMHPHRDSSIAEGGSPVVRTESDA
jgi:hypothetical protein